MADVAMESEGKAAGGLGGNGSSWRKTTFPPDDKS